MAQLGNTVINGTLLVSGALTVTGVITASIERATADSAGRVFDTSYGNSVSVSGNVLSLKAPGGQTLSTATIASATKAQQDASGRVLSSSYANTITIANSILSLKAPDGQTLSTAQISTADTLQAITNNGATTTQAITITNATNATSTSTGALKITGGLGVGGSIYAAKVIGAYWNDYAEFREIKIQREELVAPGSVVAENGDDTLSLTYVRMQPGAKIITDTFGMCIGEDNIFSQPIAVAGRVLVNTCEPRDMFKLHIGEAVCAAPGGTISLMTRKEIQEYPDRILGFIVGVPEYKYWGKMQVPVNDRIWISLK